jgi:hypothetical protein
MPCSPEERLTCVSPARTDAFQAGKAAAPESVIVTKVRMNIRACVVPAMRAHAAGRAMSCSPGQVPWYLAGTLSMQVSQCQHIQAPAKWWA